MAIIAISFGGPIVEMFDRWDQTLQDGNDTEADVVIAALCVGAAFAVGTIAIVSRIRALSSATALRIIAVPDALREVVSVLPPIPTTSPPAVLRV
jgi:hypothetical protein